MAFGIISVNYLSVLVAAIASMAVGMIWYGPLFGSQWKKLMGFTDKDIKKMKLSPMQAMVLGFITTLVTAFVLACFIGLVGAVGALQGAAIAFWAWLGFVAMITLGSVLWEGKSVRLWVLNACHSLVSFLVMGAILGAW